MSTAPVTASCATTVTRPPPFAKSSVSRSKLLRSSMPVCSILRRYTMEQRPRGDREGAVRRDRASPENGSPAAPIREDPARLFDDGEKRRSVPRRQHAVHHDLRAARRYQQIAIAI